MRIVVQRVNKATVSVNGRPLSEIKTGLLIFLGVEEEDGQKDVEWLSEKLVRLRIFKDDEGIMNRSILDVGGDILVISQFTLHAKTKKGNRPSYIKAARPDQAIPLYKSFISSLESHLGKSVFSGEFGAYMKVSLENDGPVTILIDSKNKE